jgi:putative membrane protein
VDRHSYRILQFLVLAGLAGFLSVKYLSGSLSWYINQRYMPLTVIAILGLLAMALTAIFSGRRPSHTHESGEAEQGHDGQPAEETARVDSAWGIVFICLPLIIGLTVPAKPLSASAIANRGISANAPLSAGGAPQAVTFDKPSDQRSILDWVKLFNYQSDLSSALGQQADVIGFVYHDPRLPAGQFMVSRFAITCCVADAFAIGMVVETKGAETPAENTWVRVKGPVQSTNLGGHQMALIAADSIQDAPPPAQPYLFP